MKIALFAVAALVLGVVSPAMAKDLKPAMPETAADMWGGPFIGIHGGYGQGNRNGCGDIGLIVDPDDINFPVIDPPDPLTTCEGASSDLTFDYDQSGGLFGVQGGYNWTLSEMFLVGVELDASITAMSGEIDPNSVFGGTGTWNNLVTATAKAGFTAGSFLVYTEGGVAAANASFDGNAGCQANSTHFGPVAGAGVSFKVSQQASIDLKYDHIWLGQAQSGCTSSLTVPFQNVNYDFADVPTQLLTQGTVDVVKIGLNFQLGH